MPWRVRSWCRSFGYAGQTGGAAHVEVNHGQTVQAGNAFHGGRVARRLGRDNGAFQVGMPRIADGDGDALAHRGGHGIGMQNFGAEPGHFGGLFITHGGQAMASAQDAGIAGKDAIDIGPDLNFGGGDACAHQRGGEIGAAASERGDPAIDSSADEAAHDNDAFAGGDSHGAAQFGISFPEQRGGVAEGIARDDRAAGLGVDGLHACARQGRGDNPAGEALAEAKYAILDFGIDRGDLLNRQQNVVQLVEQGENLLIEEGAGIGAEQAFDLMDVKLTQVFHLAPRRVRRASCGMTQCIFQAVRGLPHGGDYNHGTRRHIAADDPGYPFDGSGGCYRGPAEFHDYHDSNVGPYR